MYTAAPAAGVLDQLPAPYCAAVLRELSAVAGEGDVLDTLEAAVVEAFREYARADSRDRAELAADLAVVAAAFSVAAATTS